VPLPRAGGEQLADADLIAWVDTLLGQLWPEPAPVAPDSAVPAAQD